MTQVYIFLKGERGLKVAVRYQSRGGNTKAVAEQIAQQLGVTALSIEHPVEEKVDILFLGGGVYMWDMDKSLKNYIENLENEKIGQIVVFSTTGAMDVTLKRIREYGRKKGIPVNDNQLLLVMLLKGHSALGLTGGKLSDKQKKQIEEFVDKVVENAAVG